MGLVKKQSIISTIIVYIGVVIGFINVGYLSPKYFTPEEIGVRSMLFDFATIFTTFSFFGLNAAMVKFHYNFKNGQKLEGYFTYFLLLVLGAFGISIVFLFLNQNLILSIYSDKSPLFLEFIHLIYFLSAFITLNLFLEAIYRCLNDVIVSSTVREVGLRVLFLLFLILYFAKIISFNQFLILFCFSYLIAALSLFLILLSSKSIDFKISPILLSKSFNKNLLQYSFFTFISASSTVLLIESHHFQPKSTDNKETANAT